jgi:hypothetical protein
MNGQAGGAKKALARRNLSGVSKSKDANKQAMRAIRTNSKSDEYRTRVVFLAHAQTDMLEPKTDKEHPLGVCKTC